ncbi:GumC family protein [Mucilaginibacter kameinonensis]|uniref:GumC family protein n=1 Tax=Mucilaginibacter kameinonensis TaxID=452286 RepID=UPI000EF7EA10|nr:polysaccharide biosynthesis tyrosine autokinase [Mucilaginibacter kameinonensis]
MDASNSNDAGSAKISNFFNRLLFHWPLFLIFFVICFCLAVFYLKYKRPVYQIFGKVMVKDQQKEANKAALEAINLTENQTGIDEQMSLMSSIPVTRQVVEDLQLWVTYLQKTPYYSYRDIYSDTPVQFKLISRGKGSLNSTFDIVIESDSTYLIKQPNGKLIRFAFQSNLTNSFGTWRLDKTADFKQYIGKTVRIKLREIDDVVGYYQGAIHESPIAKSSVVVFRLDDEVPERGREIIDDLIRVYMAASVEQKRRSTQNTIKFVEERLGSITSELNNVESKYQGYKSARGITELADQSSVYVGNAQTNEKQVNDLKIQLSVLDGIERYLNSNDGKGTMPSIIGFSDATLQSLTDRLTDLQMEKTKLLTTLPENNPLFNPINQQINATRVSLRENLKTTRASLVATLQSLQNVGTGFKSNIRALPGAERDLSDIKRMQGIKENLYIYLLQKKEELSLDYASTISDAVVIEQAHVGGPPTPIPGSVYATALILGLVFPVGMVYGRTALKNKVSSKGSVISATGLPVLLEIVQSETDEPIVVLNQKTFIGEQFRDLRTKLAYLHKNNNNPGKTTIFTSSMQGEGKSFVLSNLGTVLAIAGKKTVLLELDLRKPTLAKRFNLNPSAAGVTDFIIGNASQAQIVQRSSISEDLDIICGGAIPPNPSELLESIQLVELITNLKLKYDHILIDTPPVHILADAMIIAHMCDLCLYVIRQDYTPNQELEFIREIKAENKLPRMKLIFNAVKSEQSANSYIYQKNSYIKEPTKSVKNRMKKFASRF